MGKPRKNPFLQKAHFSLLGKKLKKLRIAVATNEKKGLEDTVSEVFGRANTFTIADIEDEQIKVSKIMENPAASYEHGAGPIVVKELVDSRVNLVIVPQLGVGASSILEHHGITINIAKSGTRVIKAIKNSIKEAQKSDLFFH